MTHPRSSAPTPRLPRIAATALIASVLAVTAVAKASPVPADTSTPPAPPAKCEPLPPFTGSKDALHAQGAALAARGKQLPIGGPAHTDIKIEIMTLFARAGDLDMCKLLRQTREQRPLSAPQARAIGCVQQQFCRPMALASGCPAGLRNQGPEGCAPPRSCTAAGLDAQAAACKAGDTGCCAPALLMLEISDADAGMPTPESLARRRALAKTACDAGHAELCLEAAALGIGTPAAQRARACSLGHVASCSPPPRPAP